MKLSEKVLALALAAVMTASMAACGGGTAASGSKPATGSSTASEAGKETTEITFWHLFSGDEAKLVQAAVDGFTAENPDITVKVLEGTTDEKQLVAISGGNPPDVGYVIDTTLPKWADAGMLEPLEDYIAKEGMDTANFNESVFSLGKINGKQYGIPHNMDSFMLFYNKDILAELGIAEPPKTISQLQEYCLKAVKTDANGDYTRVGMIPDFPWIDVQNLPFKFGANFYDFSTDTVTANSKENIDALTFKASFYNEPYNKDKMKKFKSGFGQYQSSESPFFQGKLAFAIEGEWFPTFLKNYAPNLNYGICNVPYPDGKPELENAGRLQSGFLYVPANCKHKEEAFKFINYMVSDKALVEFCAAKGGLPCTKSGLADPTLIQKAPVLEPFVKLVVENAATAFPAVPFATEYANELNAAEEKIYNLTATPQEAMDELVAKLQPMADDWKAKRK